MTNSKFKNIKKVSLNDVRTLSDYITLFQSVNNLTMKEVSEYFHISLQVIYKMKSKKPSAKAYNKLINGTTDRMIDLINLKVNDGDV